MSEPGKYHFAGVAGVGMSSVAQAAVAAGYSVTGSDRYYDSSGENDPVAGTIRKLQISGVEFFPQDGSAITPGTAAVVVSTAIEDDNPDLCSARSQGVKLIHRSEMLAKLSECRKLIAVTGTSGKSTVTGMLGCMLADLGADPTVVNGAPVVNWITDDAIGNVRVGASDLWVIEADESDKSLLNYVPEWAVITNASSDHFSLDETLDLFEMFQARVAAGVVSGIDRDFSEISFEKARPGSCFVMDDVRFHVCLPGMHNVHNAVLAVEMCMKLGYDAAGISSALDSFRGIHRRMEIVGEACGITVIDDYAHNPAKISAAWETAAGDYGRVHAVWRPHGFGPLRTMMDDLVSVFQGACRTDDRLYLLPVYDAGGTADRSINSDVLVSLLKTAGLNAELVSEETVQDAVLSGVDSGDAVMVMGARDPWLPVIAREILAALGQ